MPVIVDEIVISIEVGGGEAAPASLKAALTPEQRQALISECAERVLEILERREER